MSKKSVLFRVDANERVGFGHVARCSKIARILNDEGMQCWFAGDISDRAKSGLSKFGHAQNFVELSSLGHYDVCLVDLMANSLDPDVVDLNEVASMQAISGSTVLVHSGVRIPTVPDGVCVFGYHPLQHEGPMPENVMWGPEYAPVDRYEFSRSESKAEQNGILVALGGAPDWSVHEAIVEVLRNQYANKPITLLASPVIEGRPSFGTNGRNVEVLTNVSSVYPLIANAEFVIASFGNLCYEALYLGARLLIVGQKQFQVECGNLLEAAGYCVSAGGNSSAFSKTLANGLSRLEEQGESMSVTALRDFDGRGIERLARVVSEKATRV